MRQLGNAVPTQLAEAMGTWMAEVLANTATAEVVAV
jgi:DNA (cytosine-5)-methyltransferase 1